MVSKNEEKPVVLAAAQEQDEIDRKMLVWANTFPDKPVMIIGSFMEAHAPATEMRTIQAAKILKKYILGGYMGEYQFSVTYRIHPQTDAQRMAALELLNRFGDWAASQCPAIGEGLRVIRIEPAARAALLTAYDDGDEDYRILMKMTYERV